MTTDERTEATAKYLAWVDAWFASADLPSVPAEIDSRFAATWYAKRFGPALSADTSGIEATTAQTLQRVRNSVEAILERIKMAVSGIVRQVDGFARGDGCLPDGTPIIRWDDVPERNRRFIQAGYGAFAAAVDASWVSPLAFTPTAIGGTDYIVFGRAGGFHGRHGRPAADWITPEFAAARGREVVACFAAEREAAAEKELRRAADCRIRAGMAAL